MSEQIQKYADEFPRLIRQAVNGLSGENQVSYAVVALLAEEDELQFSEIRTELDVHPQTLSDSLDSLERGGIVNKMAGSKIGDKSTGAYVITDFGHRILDSLFESTSPRKRGNRSVTLDSIPQELRDRIKSRINHPRQGGRDMADRVGGNDSINMGASLNVENESEIVGSADANLIASRADGPDLNHTVAKPTGRHANTPDEELAE